MGINENAYYRPRRLAPGWAQLVWYGIYTSKCVQFWSIPNNRMHMAVNMELSMRYFRINTIPWSAAYGPQIKEWVGP